MSAESLRCTDELSQLLRELSADPSSDESFNSSALELAGSSLAATAAPTSATVSSSGVATSAELSSDADLFAVSRSQNCCYSAGAPLFYRLKACEGAAPGHQQHLHHLGALNPLADGAQFCSLVLPCRLVPPAAARLLDSLPSRSGCEGPIINCGQTIETTTSAASTSCCTNSSSKQESGGAETSRSSGGPSSRENSSLEFLTPLEHETQEEAVANTPPEAKRRRTASANESEQEAAATEELASDVCSTSMLAITTARRQLYDLAAQSIDRLLLVSLDSSGTESNASRLVARLCKSTRCDMNDPIDLAAGLR